MGRARAMSMHIRVRVGYRGGGLVGPTVRKVCKLGDLSQDTS